MNVLISWLVGAIAVIGMFVVLIGPHEAGHFALAKLFRVHVIEFSLGMGNRLWSRTVGTTLYAIRLLPIGGYVRLSGMEPGDYHAPDGFHGKPAWQRLLVLLAGPAVNFLLAALIVSGLALTQVNNDPGKVFYVVKPSPAFNAGIRPGDRIESINGRRLTEQQDIRNAVAHSNGDPVTVVVRRGGANQSESLVITPEYSAEQKREVIGVGTGPVITPLDAVVAGASFPFVASAGIASGIYALASGQIPGGLLGPQGATGAIGIGYITIQAARSGVMDWLNLVALLSVALGLANLLPLPALDGGRIVVVLLEKLRGQPFDRDREMQVQRFGIAALLVLVAFIAFFDIQRIMNHQFPGLK